MTSSKDVAVEVETRPEPAIGPGSAAALVPGLTVLWHPDLERVGDRVLLPGLTAGLAERLSRYEPHFSPPGPAAAAAAPRPLGDPFLSRLPILLLPEARTGALRILCHATRTPVMAGGQPVRGEITVSPSALDRGIVLLLASRVALLLHRLDPAPPPASLAGDAGPPSGSPPTADGDAAGGPAGGLIGHSAAMLELRRELARLARLEVPVLLRGETGTGKELAARALHDAGPRSRGPFLAVNLAAVPEALAAAELFGAARGAFTGAERARPGYFRLAAGGTLLLDEIGEASPEVQSLLLRALESHEIQEVGGGEPRRVDVRLLAATDADIEAAAGSGRFRAPLLHRLASYQVRLPPLRRRRDDVGRLLLHFLRLELGALGAADVLLAGGPGVAGARDRSAEQPWLPAPLAARLADYDWPGNVRQLRNVARHLAIAGHAAATAPWGPQLEHLLPEPGAAGTLAAAVAAPALPRPAPRKLYRRAEEVGDEELLRALRAHRFRLQPAAASLGISRTALYDRIERSASLRKASDLTRHEIEECMARCQGDLDTAAAALEVSRRGLLRHMRRLGMHP
ncbi:MAG TPA: sigma 54-interacting transcriptional regulator [Thermoanaerobaculia bacterium]|nr:sigma 54-interacting transcriptional regulator [Thermoanaerobaculia bacterium]